MTLIDDAKQLAQGVLQAGMAKVVALAPDSWVPGGTPDPLIRHQHGHIGKPLSRIDGPLKVTGAARFAAEFPIETMVYAALAYSTIAKGRIAEIDTSAAEAAPGVVAGDDASQRAAPEAAAAVPVRLEGGRRRQSARDAGRSHPLERRADRRGPRRDAGAGRSRQVADPRDATRPRRRSPGSRRPRREARVRASSWASRYTTKSATRRRRWWPRRSRSTRPIARRATTTTRSSSTP